MTREDELEKLVQTIANITQLAEEWCAGQVGPDGEICMAALKDIRNKTRNYRTQK